MTKTGVGAELLRHWLIHPPISKSARTFKIGVILVIPGEEVGLEPGQDGADADDKRMTRG